jgi:hypothetical protein
MFTVQSSLFKVNNFLWPFNSQIFLVTFGGSDTSIKAKVGFPSYETPSCPPPKRRRKFHVKYSGEFFTSRLK